MVQPSLSCIPPAPPLPPAAGDSTTSDPSLLHDEILLVAALERVEATRQALEEMMAANLTALVVL